MLMPDADAITVITLTRNRAVFVERAIASVRAQDYEGPIEHLVVVDDCQESVDHLSRLPRAPHRDLVIHPLQRAANDRDDTSRRTATVYPRIARLLNLGVRSARSPWIAFLDDDNEYEANHLSSLMSVARQTGCSAVHSWRGIYLADGTPYLEPRFPWAKGLAEQRRIYELMCRRGVWRRHSHILRDRAGPPGLGPFRNSTVVSDVDSIFLVDTSVWLLHRSILKRFPVPEVFSEQDLADGTAPDDKLLEMLLNGDVSIVSTGLPTLRYHLGGTSNPPGLGKRVLDAGRQELNIVIAAPPQRGRRAVPP
jgi:glycosyltransferase involved in cell wall biosynthesis